MFIVRFILLWVLNSKCVGFQSALRKSLVKNAGRRAAQTAPASSVTQLMENVCRVCVGLPAIIVTKVCISYTFK